ncbi:hypothetical protein B0H10DRAFT_2242451 [Mycena sp. CBHHK59/15]|nr:hypothetical protein B0H10DRAFT_2242451 [Mycena sp. CBHHK59/15]
MDPAIVKDMQSRAPTNATHDQLVAAAEKVKSNTVKDAATVRLHLETSSLLGKGSRFGRADLFSALMRLSLLLQASLAKLSNTLQALAFMGEEIDDAVAQEVADPVAAMVGPIVETVVANQRVLQDDVKGLTGTSSNLAKVVEESKEELRDMKAQVENMKEMMTHLEFSVDSAKEAAHEVQAAATSTGPRTYAAAAAVPAMSAEQAGVLARAARMKHQILHLWS